MSKWVDIGPVDEFPHGCQKCLRAEETPVVVFNIDGTHRAILNVCPHAGMPLGQGAVAGKIITCPFHGYSYNVETGRNIDFPDQEPPVPTYDLRITDAGRVEVEVPVREQKTQPPPP